MREWILIETHAPSLQIHFSSKALVGENVNSELLWEWGELRCSSHLLLVLIYYNSLSAYLHRGTFIQLFVKCLVIQPLDYFSATAEVKLHLTQLHWFSRQVNLQAALTDRELAESKKVVRSFISSHCEYDAVVQTACGTVFLQYPR